MVILLPVGSKKFVFISVKSASIHQYVLLPAPDELQNSIIYKVNLSIKQFFSNLWLVEIRNGNIDRLKSCIFSFAKGRVFEYNKFRTNFLLAVYSIGGRGWTRGTDF